MNTNINLDYTGSIYDLSYESIVESLPIGTLVFRIAEGQTQVITINDKLLQFANIVHSYVSPGQQGHWDKETLQSIFSKDLYAFSVDEDVSIVQDLVKEATQAGYSRKVFRLRGTSGEHTKWIEALCSCRQLKDGSRIYYTLFIDNTSKVLYEKEILDKQKELEDLSLYDTLTKVRNRHSYNLFLNQNKGQVMKETGIIFADMNGLKSINDEFGHQFGDSVIVSFAETLLKYFDRDSVYRISGDEYVVILRGMSVVDFENLARGFVREVEQHQVAAIGYKWESALVDLKQAIYQTEQLMMIQKQRYYISNSEQKSKHRPKMLEGLVEDIKHNRFLVYLQPKAVIGSRLVIGAEALIRKLDQDGRVVPPFEFVPVLEKELLISKIDFFVLEEVCKLLQDWKRRGKRLIKISVNMSRVTVAETDFLEHVLSICDKYETERQYLEFEITESIETKDNRKLPETIITLHELGFGVALDDMGSDYSSVKMLTMDGVDMVKIDRGLVLQIEYTQGAALIRYIIALCHEIGKKCIAEGVEEERQAALLADMGCDYYQGYLLDRPIPIPDFEGYL